MIWYHTTCCRFTHFTTGHAFFGSKVAPDHDTEDDRDGRFTCEVCGRSG